MTVTDGWRFNTDIRIIPADNNVNIFGVYVARMSEGCFIAQYALDNNDAVKSVGQGTGG